MANNKLTAAESYISNPFLAVKHAATRFISSNLKTYVLLMLVCLAVAAVAAAIFVTLNPASITSSNGASVGLLAVVVFLILAAFINFIGVASDFIMVRSQNLDAVSLKASLNRGLRRFWVALAANILRGLIIFVGLILFLIPGIYLGLRLSYVGILVANEDVGPIESLKRSWVLTKGHLWDLIGAVAVTASIASVLSLLAYGLVDLADAGTYIWVADTVVAIVTIPLAAAVHFRYHQSDLAKSNELTKENTNGLNYLILLPAVILLVIMGGYSLYLDPASSDIFDFDIESIEAEAQRA